MGLYLMVLAGSVIYLLTQLNGVFNLPEFEWKVFFRTNIIPTTLNLLIGFVMVAIREEIVNLYPVTMLSAALLGVAGQAIFKKITNVFDPAKNTAIGV